MNLPFRWLVGYSHGRCTLHIRPCSCPYFLLSLFWLSSISRDFLFNSRAPTVATAKICFPLSHLFASFRIFSRPSVSSSLSFCCFCLFPAVFFCRGHATLYLAKSVLLSVRTSFHNIFELAVFLSFLWGWLVWQFVGRSVNSLLDGRLVGNAKVCIAKSLTSKG